MPEGGERPQPPGEEVKQLARKKLEQAARGFATHSFMTPKLSPHTPPDDFSKRVEEVKTAYSQVEQAADELGEIPPHLKKAERVKWIHEHYIKPVIKELDEERKRI